jgi:hypothetical protein
MPPDNNTVPPTPASLFLESPPRIDTVDPSIDDPEPPIIDTLPAPSETPSPLPTYTDPDD